MGADLYIESITDKPDETTGGYFRDSYNGTSLFWALDLSWWADVKLSNGNIDLPEVARLRQEVATRPLNITKDYLVKAHCKVVDDGEENTVESWGRYFTEKRKRLLNFFDKALELKEPIYASL